MKLNSLIALFLIIFATFTHGQQINKNLLVSINKINVIGNFPLKSIKTDKNTVFLFLSPECPLCKNYIREVNQLQVNNPNIQFISIFPGKSYNIQVISKFVNDFALKGKWIIDSKKEITKILKATVTPQAVVVSQNGELIYSGLIDDRIVSLGSLKSVITEKYLEKVLDKLSKSDYKPTKSTKPIGCLINDY